jgi:hypothetical protein
VQEEQREGREVPQGSPLRPEQGAVLEEQPAAPEGPEAGAQAVQQARLVQHRTVLSVRAAQPPG